MDLSRIYPLTYWSRPLRSVWARAEAAWKVLRPEGFMEMSAALVTFASCMGASLGVIRFACDSVASG
jgi:hypothetical protein